jgi:hypothetical protein
MCVIVAKWFDGIGWAGAKNRDRTYIPVLDFIESKAGDIDRMMMHDEVTGYKEGINSRGVSILNTSLDIGNDETEVESGKLKTSPDGQMIAEALTLPTAEAAAEFLIKNQLCGCTMVFDQDDMILIEASNWDGKRPYRFRARRIPKTQTVARTNHGVWMPTAGMQRSPRDRQQTLDRISSESRLLLAEAVVKAAQTPQDLVDGMCQVYINDPQLNILRTSTDGRKMRTTSQQLCVPQEQTLYCRPVSSHMKFDFWSLNRPDTGVWVEIMSNRELWQNVRRDPPFGHMNMQDLE